MARDYFSLVEGFESTAAWLRGAAPPDRAQAARALTEEAIELLAPLGVADFEKLAVWHTDRLYRLLNAAAFLDASSLAVLRALGAAFTTIARARGVSVAYLVDNGLPEDRLRGVSAAFQSLGFMVASPELLALRLGEADGRGPEDVLGAGFARYQDEAIMLATRLFTETVAARTHIAWLSGACDAGHLRRLGDAIVGLPYVGVFRNEAPVDGTNVQVFQTAGRREPLAF